VASAAAGSAPKPSASVLVPWPVKRSRAVCTRFPGPALLYGPSVSPSLVPRNPLDAEANAGEPSSALADPASYATSAFPSVRPESSSRVLDSAGS
jgi:hypothetical protein